MINRDEILDRNGYGIGRGDRVHVHGYEHDHTGTVVRLQECQGEWLAIVAVDTNSGAWRRLADPRDLELMVEEI